MLIGVATMVAACRGPEKAASAAYVRSTVGAATLSVPKAWSGQLEATETERQVWSPAPATNIAKETLAIRIAPRRPMMSDEAVLAAAAAAQGVLPGVKVVENHQLTTRNGLTALWLETSFQPDGGGQNYRRAHVTAVGKSHVFHIFYTAIEPDPAWAVLHEALDSLKEEG
jgi:hypothetical protein